MILGKAEVSLNDTSTRKFLYLDKIQKEKLN